MNADKNWRSLKRNDSEVYQAVVGEEKREKKGIELIPSENYAWPEVLAVNGSILTNKYSEGYPGRRYYGGQEFTDKVERLAIERAKKVFKAEHANVQPLSGSPMNQAVYFAFLKPGDTVLAMDLSHGGHLTHGAPVSHMGRIFNFVRYKTNPAKGGRIDYDEVLKLAKKHKPKIVLCGYTSYPRDYDYAKFRKIANAVKAVAMADVAHIGGLIAAKMMKNPFDYDFDVVTTTTHKTLRGPRAGLILCKKKYAQMIDQSVFPGLQGGPHMQTIAAMAVALGKALKPDFRRYAKQVLKNAQVLSRALMQNGAKLITDGTDNHMMVMDTITSFVLDGRTAETTLDKISITVNKQIVPDDPNPPLKPSGIRLGTPAATTRGMKEKEMKQIGELITEALKNYRNKSCLRKLKEKVESLCFKFRVPGLD